MITNAFFTSSIDPAKPAQDGWDRATQFLDRLQEGPIGAGGIFQYKNTDYTRIDKKALDVNMSERTTVRRSIYPQGHLGGLFRILKAQDLDPSRYILEVDLDNPWFQHRRVTAISRADFERDSIGSIDLRLVYGNDARNAILASDATTAKFEWLSQADGTGGMKGPVSGEYTVRFNNVASAFDGRGKHRDLPERSIRGHAGADCAVGDLSLRPLSIGRGRHPLSGRRTRHQFRSRVFPIQGQACAGGATVSRRSGEDAIR
jgi:hypothetical protein